MKTVNETALMKGAQAFDADVLAEIYDCYSPGIFAYAIRLLGDSTLAEDCVSETFSRFLKTLRAGSGPQDHLQAYLYNHLQQSGSDYQGVPSPMGMTAQPNNGGMGGGIPWTTGTPTPGSGYGPGPINTVMPTSGHRNGPGPMPSQTPMPGSGSNHPVATPTQHRSSLMPGLTSTPSSMGNMPTSNPTHLGPQPTPGVGGDGMRH
jgi:hypothetical protein